MIGDDMLKMGVQSFLWAKRVKCLPKLATPQYIMSISRSISRSASPRRSAKSGSYSPPRDDPPPPSRPAPKGKGCFKCGEEGHFARECPNQPQNSGPREKKTLTCFKCNEEGHFARDCPNQASDAPQRRKRVCFKCQQEGHMARDCTNESVPNPNRERRPIKCFKCQEEGHMSRNCPNNDKPVQVQERNSASRSKSQSAGRKVSVSRSRSGSAPRRKPSCSRSGSPMVNEDNEGKSSKPARRTTLCFKCHEEGHTSRNCPQNQRKPQRKGSVGSRSCSPASRSRSRSPKAHSNQDGVENDDKPKQRKPMICFKCNQEGHMSRNCPTAGDSKPSKTCFKCGSEGHMSRECPSADQSQQVKTCFKCKQEGHMSRECPNADQQIKTCFKCKEEGHMSKDCPNADQQVKTCYRCKQEGHMSRQCPNAGEGGAGKKTCFKCGQQGHMAKDCTSSCVDLTQEIQVPRYINKRRDFIETEDSGEPKAAPRRRRSGYDLNLKAFCIPGITDRVFGGGREKGGHKQQRGPKGQSGSKMVNQEDEGKARKSVSRSKSVCSRKGSASVCSRKRSVSRSVGSAQGNREGVRMVAEVNRQRSASAEGY